MYVLLDGMEQLICCTIAEDCADTFEQKFELEEYGMDGMEGVSLSFSFISHTFFPFVSQISFTIDYINKYNILFIRLKRK